MTVHKIREAMKWKYNLLGLLQLVVALGAIPAGLALIIYPDGSAVGMSTTLLSQAPFQDFLIPGLFLLIGNGLSCLNIFNFNANTKNHLTGIIYCCHINHLRIG